MGPALESLNFLILEFLTMLLNFEGPQVSEHHLFWKKRHVKRVPSPAHNVYSSLKYIRISWAYRRAKPAFDIILALWVPSLRVCKKLFRAL